ncbi:YggT family protein [Fangia hongkongensis]|uniref:YggT family protein n=1 Tax=Fangia hongkongensis TaxID=270495 RepID=UPI00036BEF0A|nr:YggT family protein [Fangia hongkongensis]MBK2124591.1 YggT family protein [Fangia hongkongensis]
MGTAFNNVGIFLVDIILSIFLYAVLLRFFLQWVKADFYNPLCQLIIRVTNPLLKPLRKIIPGFWGLDLASVVLAYIVSVILLIIISILSTGFYEIPWHSIWLIAVIKLILTVINLYIWLIIIRAISSWFTQGGYNPAIIALHQLTEPLLSKARAILPVTKSGFDFSPIIVVIVLICIQIFIRSLVGV